MKNLLRFGFHNLRLEPFKITPPSNCYYSARNLIGQLDLGTTIISEIRLLSPLRSIKN